ncbi:MAG: NAD-dependent epimerase/dehydratase family protein [Pseudomonadota bacterium]
MPAPIVLTGITGYIAKHIALLLLEAGHSVRGSLRSQSRADEVRAALRPQLSDPSLLERLSFVELDLTRDDGWTEALQGASALMHTASPFPLVQPKDPQLAIGPAVEGTKRALNAAAEAGVTRVVLTSSVVAIAYGQEPRGTPFTEADWTNTDAPGLTPYTLSKTLAERAAWDMASTHNLDLTTINPGLVVGAPLDPDIGTSLEVLTRLMRSTDPMLPQIGFSCVDVVDVARLHLNALADDATIGQRIIAAERYLSFSDTARLVQDALPDRRITTREAPNVLVRFLGLFDPTIRTILGDLGKRREAASDRAAALLGRPLRDARDSVRETAARLSDMGLA